VHEAKKLSHFATSAEGTCFDEGKAVTCSILNKLIAIHEKCDTGYAAGFEIQIRVIHFGERDKSKRKKNISL